MAYPAFSVPEKGQSPEPFASNWSGYKDWLIRSAECVHCGAKYRDRPQCYGLPGGHVWMTETDCGCQTPKHVLDELDKIWGLDASGT